MKTGTIDSKIILFDGYCNLCSGIVKFLIAHDKHKVFKFASLQSDYGVSVLNKYKFSLTAFDTFVYLRNDTFLIKSTAALYVLKDLKGLYRAGFAFIIIPKFIRDFIYGIISKNRNKLWGRKLTCMIPDLNISDRFIS